MQVVPDGVVVTAAAHVVVVHMQHGMVGFSLQQNGQRATPRVELHRES